MSRLSYRLNVNLQRINDWDLDECHELGLSVATCFSRVRANSRLCGRDSAHDKASAVNQDCQ